MRRAQNADTHALKQHRLSQNISLSAPVLYWLSHLACISSLKAKNERKTLIFTQLKISSYKHTFSLFLDKSLETDLRPIYCSLTAVAFCRRDRKRISAESSLRRPKWSRDGTQLMSWTKVGMYGRSAYHVISQPLATLHWKTANQPGFEETYF